MRPTYEHELESLDAAYAAALAWDVEVLSRAIGRLSGVPAAFTASGGMVAVATLAAQLHESTVAQPASALTPLALISRPPISDCAAVLLSSSGSHPDAVEVMRRLGRPGMRPAIVMTHRQAEDFSGVDAQILTLPPLPVREGFLAVNSVVSMAVALIRAYAGDVLPHALGQPVLDHWPEPIERLLVLCPPHLAAAAADVETRASEIGLAAVQTTDFRNFAHGRHTGLARVLDRTTVVALSDSESQSLADATVATLPSSANVLRWHSDASWPTSALQLIVRSMWACGALGARQKLSMARPRVPQFGRRLYRLPIRRRLPDVLVGPVERKLVAAGTMRGNAEIRRTYEFALHGWVNELDDQRFGALVLDYDGTACTTEGRFDPPQPAVAHGLNAVLDEGALVGFASGRGPSLHRDLRKVIHRTHWDNVLVGLYNGGVLARLSDELGDLREPAPLIVEVHDRLAQLPIASTLSLQSRRVQLTVETAGGALVNPAVLAGVVIDALAQHPALPVKVVRSGHSLDIVPSQTSKTDVVAALADSCGASVLAIGDQGQIGGNDYELLAADRWSLTVDRCSPDPTRCWYLGDGSVSGPVQLVRYLNSLVHSAEGHVLKSRALR